MIKNVVFDIGNVFVRWSPETVVERVFGAAVNSAENAARARSIFGSSAWIDVNCGLLTMKSAIAELSRQNNLTAADADALMFHITDHLDALPGTEALAHRLKSAGYRIFALTDNVHEIVAYLKARHSFWPLFEGVANSAEIGVMKPDPGIYQRLLDDYGLYAADCIFMDDILRNVEGAKSIGMSAFVFENARQAEGALRASGLDLA